MSSSDTGRELGGGSSFEHAGWTFELLTAGPPDGEVVILLHGFPQTNASLARLADVLGAAGYRVLVPDQRGYSPGARARDRGSYRLPELVGDVAALIRGTASAPVHVVGHDFGATLAWMLAAHQPELVRTVTAISVPHPGAHLLATRRGIQALRSWYMVALQLPRVPELVLDRAGTVERFLTSTGQSTDAARRDAAAIEADHRGPVNWYRGLFLTPHAYQRVHTTRPALQIWGSRDPFVARSSVALNPGFVDASYELDVYDGLGHWIPDAAPERAAASILDHIRAHG